MRRRLVGSMVVALGACAFNPAERAPDGGGEVDGAVDASEIDASEPDAAIDASEIDASVDASIDAPDVDAATDAAIDAATDAATDAAIDAGTITSRTLVDDTAAELGAGPPTANTGRIDASGLFAPRAYYRGGLCASGSNTRLFDDGPTGGFPVLAAFKPSLARATSFQLPVATLPPGVGITDAQDWTLILDGEISLTAGMHTFGFGADDHGMLELGQPGSTTFTRLIGVNGLAVQTAMFVAPADGWYPIRYAIAQRMGPAGVRLQLAGVDVSRLQTRCRVDQRAGLAIVASDEPEFLDVAGTSIDGTPQALAMDWMASRPTDLGIGSTDGWTVRWSGQVRIDVAGTYTLRWNTDDGQRLWIDGTKVLDVFDDSPHDLTTAPIVLAVGWHDLVADISENTGNASASLTVATGPELVGASFPVTRLRPSEARGERFEARTITQDAPIAGSVTFRIDAPSGAVVTGVDIGYRISHSNILGVSSRLSLGGTSVGLRGTGSTSTLDRFHLTGFNGMAPAGIWTLQLGDVVGSGTIDEAWLTVRYADAAGSGPIAVAAYLESSVRDLLAPAAGVGAVISVDQVRFTARDVVGDTIGVLLRTCDDPTGCAAAPWAGPYASGASPGVVPRRYVQYAISIASDTDHEPALDRLELDYQTQ